MYAGMLRIVATALFVTVSSLEAAEAMRQASASSSLPGACEPRALKRHRRQVAVSRLHYASPQGVWLAGRRTRSTTLEIFSMSKLTLARDGYGDSQDIS